MISSREGGTLDVGVSVSAGLGGSGARFLPLSVLPLPRLAQGSGLSSDAVAAAFGSIRAELLDCVCAPRRKELPSPENAGSGSVGKSSFFLGALEGSKGT